MSTAHEIALRLEENERKTLKMYTAVSAMIDEMVRYSFRVIERYWRDEQIELDRMTDDGCPLF
jgi:hypothetical protein